MPLRVTQDGECVGRGSSDEALDLDAISHGHSTPWPGSPRDVGKIDGEDV